MTTPTDAAAGRTAPAAPHDVWRRLAAPLPPERIRWRQQGKPTDKGKAQFVAYVDPVGVREVLDEHAPGAWEAELLLLEPRVVAKAGGAEEQSAAVAFRCRLTVYGVAREDVGSGRDYKTAATDAFKRAAQRFGIGHNLHGMRVWVELEDPSQKFPKPKEDPQRAWERLRGVRPAEPRPAAARAAPLTVGPPPPAGLKPITAYNGQPLGEIPDAELREIRATYQRKRDATPTPKADWQRLIDAIEGELDRRLGERTGQEQGQFPLSSRGAPPKPPQAAGR
jgi:hypothetical protein